MPKGFFTQSSYILLEAPVPTEDVEKTLAGCTVRGHVQFRETDPEGNAVEGGINWAGSDSIALDLRSDARAALLVDVIAEPFPDRFGFVEDGAPTDARLFAALATGQFGPFIFPGSLERAWDMGRAADRGLGDVRERHKAFLRLRSTWALRESPSEAPPTVPPDYDPAGELRFLAEVATNLLELPGALAFFNPNGEILASLKEVEEALDRADEHEIPPLDLYANLRLIEISDLTGWAVVDTIGMLQLDVPDHEIFFQKDRYDPHEIALFARQASFFSLKEAKPFVDGATTVGPGGVRWRALTDRLSMLPAPRQVVRWIALDGSEASVPKELLAKPEPPKDPE